ncbi:MAG TPA: anti-sigma factor antagonist [Armatimonadota bacterium]|mgnify:FL=1|jgi:anti-anti-sigma factor|nr:anti-sigma factor antagonist [Armatimonadota bacterium]HPO73068.1 anti-sigma factor antagonist [Armatimonadota bacterium]HPT99701.1 anti-sigma factor antagonist [Armatimonadota bacterium]
MPMDTGEVVAVTFQPLVSETALQITEKRDGEVAYVGATGEIDLHGEEMLRRVLESSLSQGGYSVILDLRHVSYMDTGALKILLETKRRTLGCGGELYILVEESLPKQVIYMAHLQDAVKMYETVDQALEDIARRATCRGYFARSAARAEEPEGRETLLPYLDA